MSPLGERRKGNADEWGSWENAEPCSWSFSATLKEDVPVRVEMPESYTYFWNPSEAYSVQFKCT